MWASLESNPQWECLEPSDPNILQGTFHFLSLFHFVQCTPKMAGEEMGVLEQLDCLEDETDPLMIRLPLQPGDPRQLATLLPGPKGVELPPGTSAYL